MKPKEIQELLDFIAQSGLEEVNIETEQFKIAVKKHAGFVSAPQVHQVAISQPVAQPLVQQVQNTPKVEVPKVEVSTVNSAVDNLITIKSPMIGTFYSSGSPDSPALVNVGDDITKGQPVCIIEAMKLFNEIESDISGRIVKILVQNATPVEFDQPLFLVESN